jgi:acyl-coenzyme A thioesterase PaaI-like protein
MPTPPAHPTELDAPQNAFLSGAGLILDEVGATQVVGHIDLGPDHHTPWGIVHGGVYATAVESAASVGAWQVDINDQAGRLVAHGELRLQNIARNAGGAAALAETATAGLINRQPEEED